MNADFLKYDSRKSNFIPKFFTIKDYIELCKLLYD